VSLIINAFLAIISASLKSLRLVCKTHIVSFGFTSSPTFLVIVIPAAGSISSSFFLLPAPRRMADTPMFSALISFTYPF
jgi:hypothetical protein